MIKQVSVSSDPWICIKGKVFKRSSITQICLGEGPERFMYIRLVLNIEGKSSPDYVSLDYGKLPSLLGFINCPSEYNFIYD